MVVLNRLVAAKPWILQMSCLFQLHVAKHVHFRKFIVMVLTWMLLVPGKWINDRLFLGESNQMSSDEERKAEDDER